MIPAGLFGVGDGVCWQKKKFTRNSQHVFNWDKVNVRKQDNSSPSHKKTKTNR